MGEEIDVREKQLIASRLCLDRRSNLKHYGVQEEAPGEPLPVFEQSSKTTQILCLCVKDKGKG